MQCNFMNEYQKQTLQAHFVVVINYESRMCDSWPETVNMSENLIENEILQLLQIGIDKPV